MSRENRVNPGSYTQAGRLTPDDAARELVKQRQSLSASHGKGNPKAGSAAWMHQAQQSRPPRAAGLGPAAPSDAAIVAGAAAICLLLYAGARLASAALARRAPSRAPGTNHTPGRPYAYGV